MRNESLNSIEFIGEICESLNYKLNCYSQFLCLFLVSHPISRLITYYNFVFVLKVCQIYLQLLLFVLLILNLLKPQLVFVLAFQLFF